MTVNHHFWQNKDTSVIFAQKLENWDVIPLKLTEVTNNQKLWNLLHRERERDPLWNNFICWYGNTYWLALAGPISTFLCVCLLCQISKLTVTQPPILLLLLATIMLFMGVAIRLSNRPYYQTFFPLISAIFSKAKGSLISDTDTAMTMMDNGQLEI